MLPRTKRGKGIEMDLATREANEKLLRDKEALESTGNMKKTQNNLEVEKTRHEQGIVRIEWAHSKAIADVVKGFVSEVVGARDEMRATNERTEGIRQWLEYEKRKPFEGVSKKTWAQISKPQDDTSAADILDIRNDINALDISIARVLQAITQTKNTQRQTLIKPPML
ncbi:hypothetical protein EVAR_34605_1 [Eumeta japonica]|uniref:Uncharacterized protein n=1 Tax=Eumeta variegata TaxID=151549 RepID=A0A4C1VG24_EUMVA|nr:hypothetical protein EVAR_34605_1 [Eumeta japonica]